MNYIDWIKNTILAINVNNNKIIDYSSNNFIIQENNIKIKSNGFSSDIPSIVFNKNDNSYLRITYADDFSTLSNNMSLDFYFKLYSLTRY